MGLLKRRGRDKVASITALLLLINSTHGFLSRGGGFGVSKSKSRSSSRSSSSRSRRSPPSPVLLPPMGRGVARAAEAAEEDDDPLFLGLGPSEEDEVEPGEVFCNRELAMSTVEAIGFDMDYTIAQYKREFDLLAYDGALAKLVGMGYPKAEVEAFSYQPERFTRGLVLDKRRGNILKMDRYKYVRVAAHGSRKLSRDERRAIYSGGGGGGGGSSPMPTYTGKDYVNVDTLFHIVDAVLFEQLVDLKDAYAEEHGKNDNNNNNKRKATGEDEGSSSVEEEDDDDDDDDDDGGGDGDGAAASKFLAGKSYFDIYTDVRRCVDLCHRDGVIKDRVAEDPSKYVIRDPALFPMLEQFRLAGKKVFLLTNSLYDYTHVVMNYLYDGTVVSREDDPNAPRFRKWYDAFDVIVCGSCKPAFLQDPYLSLFRVDPDTQLLQNTDGVPVSPAAAQGRPMGSGGGVGGGGDKKKKKKKQQQNKRSSNEEDVDGEGGEDEDPAAAFLADGKVFQGGNWLHLHDMLSVSSGDGVLYVGDHTYSDILRSKRTLGWRTCLVIPELEREMKTYRKAAVAGDWRRLQRLLRLRDEADREVDALALKLYRADMALMKEAEHEVAVDGGAARGKGKGAAAAAGGGGGGGGGKGGAAAMRATGGVVGAGVGGEFRDLSATSGGLGLLDDDDDEEQQEEEEEEDGDVGDAGEADGDGKEDGSGAASLGDVEAEAGDEDEDDEDVYDFERSARETMAEELADQLVLQASAKEDVREACRHYHYAFHGHWGQIFKAGFMDSRFAKQIVDYACIYTTRASDLGSVSPTRDFRPFSDLMAHDLFARQNDLGDESLLDGDGQVAGLDDENDQATFS